jgi:sigma-B regulation protein RsbU (phosphoserine phosphatase)
MTLAGAPRSCIFIGMEIVGDGQADALKILLVSSDVVFAQQVRDLMFAALPGTDLKLEAKPDAALALLASNHFSAMLFDVKMANAASLFQMTSFATHAPRVPLLVLGPDDENFLTEAVFSGSEDYLARESLAVPVLRHAVVSAIARHQEKNSLLEEKENYYGIFDHLVEGIFRTTPDGHYLLANVALARIYGYGSPVELMASIKDIANRLYILPGRREEFVRQMQVSDTLTAFESQIFRKDGTVIWISENCRAVRDAQGKLLYYEGTVEDITRERQIEEALRNSESLYHSLVETMPQNVFRKDLEGRFTFANRQYCEHYHCRQEDIIGKTDYDFFPRELAEKYQSDDDQVMRSEQTSEIIEEHHPFGQEKTVVQVVKTPLYGPDGKVVGLQGIFWDITEKKRAEEKIRHTTAELARSREELRSKNQAMEENLRVAGDIQLTMLPQQYPAFPQNVPPEQSAFRFVHRYQPSEGVSGDFFNVSAISDTEVGVLICDVTGHGIRAALVTAMIRALAEELKPLARDPGNFLQKLNSDLGNILKNTGSPMLTTAFYLVANCETSKLRFANAGHPKPLLVRRSTGDVTTLGNACGRGQPALGLFENPAYETTETSIVPGDFVMLFTDGLYEVQGQNEELYSQQRLLLDVKNLMHLPPGALFDELIAAIRFYAVGNTFDDDVCLVGIDFNPRLGAS